MELCCHRRVVCCTDIIVIDLGGGCGNEIPPIARVTCQNLGAHRLGALRFESATRKPGGLHHIQPEVLRTIMKGRFICQSKVCS